MSHPTWNGPLVEAGVLEPLNDLLPNLDKWPAASKDGWTYDGNLMAVTWTPSPVVLYYNKVLLEKAGFTEAPKTWDEVLTMARAVAKLGKDEAGNQIYGFGISSKKLPGAGYFALPFLNAYGGKFVDDNGNVVVDSPENVKAFTEMKALFDEGVSPEGLEIRDLRNLFATGTMGFHMDIEAGIGIFAGLSAKGKDFANDYGIVVVPGATPDKGGESILIEHNLVIYKDSERKEEAALFIDYLTGPEGIQTYNDAGNVKLPIRSDTAEIEFYQRPGNAFMQVFIDQLANARPLPAQSSAFLGAMEELANAIQRISVNNEDPATTLKETQATIQGLYKQ
jgi:multiple sugar transport system substrate-binding protein